MKLLKKRRTITVLLVVFLLIFATACGSNEETPVNEEEETTTETEDGEPEATEAVVEEEPEAVVEEEPEAVVEEEEKVLIIGHSEVTESYDLAHAFNPTSGMVNQVTYDTLVTFPAADASSIEPNLATTWSVSDDDLSYTFELRDDVTFANGDPLTADDVVFSFTRLINVKSNPSFLADPIASVEAVDDLTVVITLVEPRPSFLSDLVNAAFSVSNDTEVMAAGGTNAEDAASTDGAQEFLDQNSVGTGPYMLESWTPQVETVLVRNPGYWGESPYFDRIIIVNIPEAATQQVALESGDIDLATDLTPDQVTGLQDVPDLTIFRGTSIVDPLLAYES